MDTDRRKFLRSTAAGLAAASSAGAASHARGPGDDPLPSWNDVAAKRSILDFVARTTREGGPDFVPPADRIAVFDNDGTLWCERPMYVQLAFALDRAKALAPEHPDWADREPFRSALAGDPSGLAAAGEKAVAELLMATHAGVTADEFSAIAKDWLATAKHPRFGRPYTECVYVPMLEMLAFLRRDGFRTYIVSGGGVEMIRTFAEAAYGIPPEQVVGSTIRTRYEARDGAPALVRLPEVDFVNDGPGKPSGIQKFIGRRPTIAFGNSDGDFEMCEWATSGPRPGLAVLLHHTDPDREYAYDRDSPFGRLDRGLDQAGPRGWILVDMKADFRRVFPFDLLPR